MRAFNLSSASYAPNNPPVENELSAYLVSELQRISAAINAVSVGHLDKSYAAPAKPRDGDLRYADGTSWNPGSGAGIYWFNGSAWAKL